MKRSVFALLPFAVAAACATSADDPRDFDPVVDASVDAPGNASTPDASPPRPIDDAGPDARPDAGSCSSDNWCTTALPFLPEAPDGGVPDPAARRSFNLVSVWVADTREAFAISAGGDLLGWDGTRWNVLLSTGRSLTKIWGSSPSELWVGAEGSIVLRLTRSADGSFTVQENTLPVVSFPAGVRALTGGGPGDIWASTDLVYHLEDGAWVQSEIPTTFRADADADAGDAGDQNVVVTAEIAELWHDDAGVLWGRGGQTRFCDTCDFLSEGLLVRRVAGTWEAVDLGVHRELTIPPISAAGPSAPWLCKDRDCREILRSAPTEGGLDYEVEATTMPEFAEATSLWSGGSSVWLTSSVGQVRHRTGSGTWEIGRLTATRTPILQRMNDVSGVVQGGVEDVWIVGLDLALHRVGAP